jgi:hypothetical protein
MGIVGPVLLPYRLDINAYCSLIIHTMADHDTAQHPQSQ